MKVLIVQGSPRKEGNTNLACKELKKTLEADGVEAEIYWIGAKPIGGCMACQACSKLGKCVIDDKVNEFRELAHDADAFIFAAPVHYSHAGSNLLGFMDRLFYSGGSKEYAHRPAAAVAVARRGGSSFALEDINKFFTISQMPVVSSYYWNMVYGRKPGEAEQDAEGMSTMRQLAHNMAWLLKCIEAGHAAGVEPVDEPRAFTNFIR